MEFVIPGCVFLELLENNNIDFEGKRVVLRNLKSVSPIHDYMLKRISDTKRNLKISSWISRFRFSYRKLKQPIREQLTEKRIIRLENGSFLFFKWKKPILVRREIRWQLIDEIERLIFQGTESEKERHYLSMLIPAEMMRKLFPDREKRRRAIEKMKAMKLDNPVAEAVVWNIKTSRTAVIAAS
jgi:hypothetical protein